MILSLICYILWEPIIRRSLPSHSIKNETSARYAELVIRVIDPFFSLCFSGKNHPKPQVKAEVFQPPVSYELMFADEGGKSARKSGFGS